MRLSDLVARCGGNDLELAVEDENGIPRPVVALDFSFTTDGTYVVLEPAREED